MKTVATPAKPTRPTGVYYILVTIALLALGIALWRLSHVLIITFGGILIATLLRALARPLRRFRKLSDHGRVAVALIALTVILIAVGWIFGHQVGKESDELRRLLPQQLQHLADTLNQSDLGRTVVHSVQQRMRESKGFDGLGAAAMAAMGGALDALLIGFIGIYFAFDPEFYLDGALRVLPVARRPEVRLAMIEAGEALSKWLLAQLAAMVIIGILAGSVLATLGVPLALVLGALAGVLEFIPVIGPFLFGIPGILVAFSRGPRLALYTMVAYIVVQQLESNLIVPLLQRWAVQLPPVVSLLAVVVAGILLGPAGIVFAAPLAVVTIALVKHLYVEDVLEHRHPVPRK
jgi:predicted PurR-regulated permease PerM